MSQASEKDQSRALCWFGDESTKARDVRDLAEQFAAVRAEERDETLDRVRIWLASQARAQWEACPNGEADNHCTLSWAAGRIRESGGALVGDAWDKHIVRVEARGRTKERADIVAWCRRDERGLDTRGKVVDAIEAAEHKVTP